MTRILRRFVPWLIAGSLSLVLAAPVAAAQPIFASGLVTVVIVDAVDVEDVTVQVPIAAAVNICDTTVAALLAQIADTGSATCTATATSNANRGGSGGGN